MTHEAFPRSARRLPDDPAWDRMAAFPMTRYMGSKYRLLWFLWEHTKHLPFETVLDAFSGSGCVSYMYKIHDKRVTSNDLLLYPWHVANALIANDGMTLSEAEITMLQREPIQTDGFIREMFRGLYFTDEENLLLEEAWHRAQQLDHPSKRSLALASLCRACIKKRPRGIFTYTGMRYDDGRRDLRLSLKNQFAEALQAMNAAVFKGPACSAHHGSIFDLRQRDFDLVYLDPPYLSTKSDNDYLRRYHFVEGLCSYWKDADIMHETKTKKLRRMPTAFDDEETIEDTFHRLLSMFPRSTFAVSYSSNCLPDKAAMLRILREHRPHVVVHECSHRYSFENRRSAGEGNDVFEYLFLASFRPL